MTDSVELTLSLYLRKHGKYEYEFFTYLRVRPDELNSRLRPGQLYTWTTEQVPSGQVVKHTAIIMKRTYTYATKHIQIYLAEDY